MPSFGFKLPIFIFAAVSTLAQTAPGQPATPKPIPANAAPDSGIKQWKFAVVSIRKITPAVPGISELRRLTDIK